MLAAVRFCGCFQLGVAGRPEPLNTSNEPRLTVAEAR